MNKCLGKDRNKDLCRNNQLDETNFCKFHQYMNDYTDEMLNNLTLCSGCKKMYYMTEGRQCEKCNKRGEQNRIKNKNKVLVCIKEGCMFKQSEENEYCGKHQQEYFKKLTELEGKKVCTNYIRGCRIKLEKKDIYSRCLECRKKDRVKCNFHVEHEIAEQNYNIEDEIILYKEPVKFTRNNNINIIEDINEENKIDDDNLMNNNSIDNDEMTIFDSPKIITSIDESEKSDNLKVGKNIASINKTYIVPEYIVGSTKLLYDIIEEFDNMGIDYPLANTLMSYNYKVNYIIKYIDATKKDGKFNLDNLKKCTNEKCKKEMPEHAYIDKFNRIVNQCLVCRLHIQIKSKRQTRINSKALWKEKNPEKVAKYFLDGRGRQIEKKGIEKYLEDNAKNAKAWRDNNPEKQKEINGAKKNDILENYKVYLGDADFKNIDMAFSFEEYKLLVLLSCFYCGTIQNKGFNGIDKMNCYKGYTKDNCVSCCSMCNIMKGTLTPNIFVKRIEHILTYNKCISGNIYPTIFINHKGSSYKEYYTRAVKKINKSFEITMDDYLKIIAEKCYICGKESKGEHRNGIDRIDNDKGYTLDNVKPCCGECNYSKNDFKLQDYLNKSKEIYEYQNKTCNVQLKYLDKRNVINIKEFHLNKKTKEEIKNNAYNKKIKNRQQLIEKYSSEDFKKDKAKELVELKKNLL